MDVGLPTTLFGGPPELGNVIKLAQSQIGFMNVFAKPLFEAVTDIIPAMRFAVEEISKNVSIWQGKIEQEKMKETTRGGRHHNTSEGFPSPRSNGVNRPSDLAELSHPDEGPSASATSLQVLSPNTQLSLPSRESRRSSVGSISALLAGASASQTGSHDPSRRSSLGSPILGGQALGSSLGGFAGVGSSADTVSFSRRSSGAFPSASIVTSNLQTRRSSNTLPSQLQLGTGPGQQTFATAPPSAENIQPCRPPAPASSIPPDDHIPATALPLSGPSSRDSHSGGGLLTHRGSKHGSADASPSKQGDGRPPATRQHGSVCTSRRASTLERSGSPTASNEAHTTADGDLSLVPTAYSPASPAGTQATSFLTVDSDGKDRGLDGDAAAAPLNVVDLDRPGSGGGSGVGGKGEAEAEAGTVKTSVGGAGGNGTGNGSAGVGGGDAAPPRVVHGRGSRFLNFWKKRGRGPLGASP